MVYGQAVEAEKTTLQKQVAQLETKLKDVKQECTQTLQVKERLLSQQNIELTQKFEVQLEEKAKEIQELKVKAQVCGEQLQMTLD